MPGSKLPLSAWSQKRNKNGARLQRRAFFVFRKSNNCIKKNCIIITDIVSKAEKLSKKLSKKFTVHSCILERPVL